jgi:hypothetical protein
VWGQGALSSASSLGACPFGAAAAAALKRGLGVGGPTLRNGRASDPPIGMKRGAAVVARRGPSCRGVCGVFLKKGVQRQEEGNRVTKGKVVG